MPFAVKSKLSISTLWVLSPRLTLPPASIIKLPLELILSISTLPLVTIWIFPAFPLMLLIYKSPLTSISISPPCSVKFVIFKSLSWIIPTSPLPVILILKLFTLLLTEKSSFAVTLKLFAVISPPRVIAPLLAFKLTFPLPTLISSTTVKSPPFELKLTLSPLPLVGSFTIERFPLALIFTFPLIVAGTTTTASPEYDLLLYPPPLVTVVEPVVIFVPTVATSISFAPLPVSVAFFTWTIVAFPLIVTLLPKTSISSSALISVIVPLASSVTLAFCLKNPLLNPASTLSTFKLPATLIVISFPLLSSSVLIRFA